jgi:hypothetical protein
LSPVASEPGKSCPLSFSFGTWGTACIKQQNFNSSALFANLRSGAPFRRRTAAPAWFDLRRGRRRSDGDACRSDNLAVAGRVSAQDPSARNLRVVVIETTRADAELRRSRRPGPFTR